MRVFKFKNVVIDSYALNLPETEVTSYEIEEQLSSIYKKLGLPFGTLERASGIKARRLWPVDFPPSKGAFQAAKEALTLSSLKKEDIGAIFNCSVTRDYFEPATACLVHGMLELSEHTIALDITNACIGFSNGILLAANLIETGVIKGALLVSSENVRRIIDNSINFLLNSDDISRADLIKILPTFTLGCGAAAMVLSHKDLSSSSHFLIGAVARSATQFNDLCNGNGDFYFNQAQGFNPIMYTESGTLMSEAARLGRRMWQDFSNSFNWSREEIDHIFCHQVGKQVNDAFYNEMTLDIKKEFTVYEKLGNLVSAALPAAFIIGTKEKNIKTNDK
ncbi:MAG: 3-oxoacyl-ACP synthase III, partial [Candidatus Dadabacteria bacterium]